MNDENLSLASSFSSAVTKLGSGGAVVFGLTLNELGVVVGIATAVLGLIMQGYFGLKKLQYQKKTYEAMSKRARDTGKGEL